MKKIFALALCVAAVGSMSAQKANVDQAKKLAGKLDKIEEARGLIREAIANPETAQDANTYYIAGKVEFDAFDNGMAQMALNPNANVNPMDMGAELLNGYEYFVQALPLDQVPNEKGQVKPRFTKDIVKKLAGHHNDYFTAGANFFNNKMYYPQAYNAFMIYSDMPEMEVFGKDALQVPDTIRATSYFNAGLCAYSANKVREAAEAFKKARLSNYTAPEAYIYEIACWQNLAQNDSTLADDAQNAIINVANAGYKKFGLSNPIFINNLVNIQLTSNQPEQALETISDALAQYPDNANLYGLRGYVYDRMGKDQESLADYDKAVALPDVDFETLKNASKKFFRVGTELYNLVEGNTPEAKAKRQEIKSNYWEKALSIAKKAQQMNSKDSDLEYVIDNINYALETYF